MILPMVQPRGLGQPKQCCNPDVLVNNTPLKIHLQSHWTRSDSFCYCFVLLQVLRLPELVIIDRLLVPKRLVFWTSKWQMLVGQGVLQEGTAISDPQVLPAGCWDSQRPSNKRNLCPWVYPFLPQENTLPNTEDGHLMSVHDQQGLRAHFSGIPGEQIFPAFIDTNS